MIQIKKTDLVLPLFVIGCVLTVSLISWSYVHNDVFSDSWSGYSQFLDIVRSNSKVTVLTIDPHAQYTEITTNTSKNMFYFTNDYTYPMPRNSNLFYFDYPFPKNPGTFQDSIFDLQSTEKRDDLIIANYSFLDSGLLLFRFPQLPSKRYGQNDFGPNEYAIARTSHKVTYDSNRNGFLDDKDAEGYYPLITLGLYSDKHSSSTYNQNNASVFNIINPSIFTNDLLNKQDNRQFLESISALSKNTYVIIEQHDNIASASYIFFKNIILSFTNFGLIQLLIFTLILFFVVSGGYIYFNNILFKEKYESETHEFSNVVNSIISNSSGNKLFYDWVLQMHMTELRTLLFKRGINNTSISFSSFDSYLKSRYPDLKSIDLSIIFQLYAHNTYDVKELNVTMLKNLCKQVNFVIHILKRGYR